MPSNVSTKSDEDHAFSSLRCACGAAKCGRYVPSMQIKALVIAIAVLLGACASSHQGGAATEPDQTFIDLFEKYNDERRKLPVAELKRELEALPTSPTAEDYGRIEILFKKIDVSGITKFLLRKAPSTTTLEECLRYVQCGAVSLLTMHSWAKIRINPSRVERGEDGHWVKLHYRGVDGDGVSANGDVVFVREDKGWKISQEWFGGQ